MHYWNYICVEIAKHHVNFCLLFQTQTFILFFKTQIRKIYGTQAGAA